MLWSEGLDVGAQSNGTRQTGHQGLGGRGKRVKAQRSDLGSSLPNLQEKQWASHVVDNPTLLTSLQPYMAKAEARKPLPLHRHQKQDLSLGSPFPASSDPGGKALVAFFALEHANQRINASVG